MVNIKKETKNGKVEALASITLNPTPNNCYECPFFYMPNPDEEDTWYEHWDCFLKSRTNFFGVALERPADCPLD